MTEPTKIIELTASNVKRLVAVEIHPKGHLVEITGANAAGKSSVLDSICMALAGSKWHGAKPIRDGEDSAKICVTLDNGMVVTRQITNKGSTLKVMSPEGSDLKSPQAVLDKLVGNLSFDPLAFALMDSKAQLETLKGLVGIDFTTLDKERAEVYGERSLINKTLKTQEATASLMVFHQDAPANEIVVSDLMTQLEEADAHNAQVTKSRKELADTDLLIGEREEYIAELKQKLEEAEAALVTLKTGFENMKAAAATLESKDTATLKQQIKTAEDTNIKVRANKKRAEAREAIRKTETDAEQKTKRLDAIDAEKQKTLTDAKFPVDGLAFDENGVLFENGIPLSQASSAETIRVSVAMGLAMNPQLKVLLVRNGSLLDDNGWQIIADMATKADAQIWVEKVDTSGQIGIVIEDGMVKTVN